MASLRSLRCGLATLALASCSLLVGCNAASQNDQKGSLSAASCPDPTPWSTTLDGISAGNVVFDSQCNLVLSGEVVDAASARVGGQKLELKEGWFVLKIGGDGKLAWAKSFGELGASTGGVNVAATATGDLIVGGVFTGTIPLATGNLVASAQHSFVARLDPSGTARWGRVLPGDVASVNVDLATDEARVTGSFTSTADFGGTSLTSAGGTDILVLRFDASGSLKKATSFGGDTNDSATFVASTRDGGLAISGGWGLPTQMVCDETGACYDADDRFGFIARVDAEGALLWKQQVQLHGPHITSGAVTASPTGELMVWESTSPTFHVYGEDGTEHWSKTFDPFTNGVARYDASGGLVLAGYFLGDGTSAPDFGGGKVKPQAGSNAAFVAKLDPGGAHVFSESFANASIGSVDVTAGGAVVIAGGLGGEADFGSGTLKAGKTTSFLARFGAKTLVKP